MAEANKNEEIIGECLSFIRNNMARKLRGYEYNLTYNEEAQKFEIVFAKGKPAPLSLFEDSKEDFGIFKSLATHGVIFEKDEQQPVAETAKKFPEVAGKQMVEEFEIHLSAHQLYEFVTGKSNGAMPRTELELALGKLFGHYNFTTGPRREAGVNSTVIIPNRKGDAYDMFEKLQGNCGTRYRIGCHVRLPNFGELEVDTQNAEELASVVTSRRQLTTASTR